MAINIPTVQENIDAALASLESKMGQQTAIQKKAFLLVLSRLQGLMKSSLYLFGAEQIKRVLAITAPMDALINIGAEYNVVPKAAKMAQLIITVTGTAGTSIPITTVWKSEANGFRYFQNQAYTIGAGGTVAVTVTAEDVGVAGSLKVGDTLTIGAVIPNVSDAAVVASVAQLGADEENVEDFRVRVLDELRTVGGGSNLADIRTWGQETPNVYRIYPYTGKPPWTTCVPGERTIYVESTTAFNPDGIPDATLLSAVRQYITYDPITGKTRQALGSTDETLHIYAITRKLFTLKLYGFSVDSAVETECKNNIQLSADSHLRSFSPFVEGLDPISLKNNTITSVSVAESVQDIIKSYGGYVERIEVMLIPGSPIGKYMLNPGERAKATVTYA